MKKLAKLVLFLSLVGLSVRTYARAGSPLQAVADRTPPELSVPFNSAMRDAAFSIPEPSSFAPELSPGASKGRGPAKPLREADPAAPVNASVKTPQPDYLPFAREAVYEYDYTSSEFPGSKVIQVEYHNYSENDNTVSVSMAVFNRPDNNKAGAYAVYANAAGVYASDSPLGGKRLEFPLPAAVGRTWTEGSDTHKIATLTGKVSVPAGSYAGCLMVLARLGGGDAGMSERFYAPGIGLVYESVTAEDVQETIKLVSYRLK